MFSLRKIHAISKIMTNFHFSAVSFNIFQIKDNFPINGLNKKKR